MLARRDLLAVIASAPDGLTVAAIRAALPDARKTAITAALGDLLRLKRIERHHYGSYRLPPPPPPKTLPPMPVGSGFIRPPSRERLMAGR